MKNFLMSSCSLSHSKLFTRKVFKFYNARLKILNDAKTLRKEGIRKRRSGRGEGRNTEGRGGEE